MRSSLRKTLLGFHHLRRTVLRGGPLWLWLAVRDLVRPGARQTTAVMVVTVAFVTLLTLLVFGLFLGYDVIQRERILHDPLQLCIWVGDRQIREAWIEPDRLKDLQRALSEELPGPGALRGCYPLFKMSLDIHLLQKGAEQGHIPIEGRTIASDDPLFESRPLQAGRVPTPGDDDGLVVTPQLLKQLHWSADTPLPDKLRVRVPSGLDVDVPVLGVTRDNLPLQFLFLVSEPFRIRWLKAHRNVRAFTVHTGPIPDGWPRWDKLPKTVREAIFIYDLVGPKPVGNEDKPTAWWFNSTRAETWLAWSVYLRQIHELMVQAGFRQDSRFAVPKTVGVDPQEEPPSIYHMAVIYVQSADLLKPARDASLALRIPAVDDEQTIERLEKQNEYSRQGQMVLGAIIVLVGLIAAWNLGVIQAMRSHQKLEDIGMLKAMGMTFGLCNWLYLVESVMFWAAGFVAGWLLAPPIGTRLGPRLLADPNVPDEALLAFDCGWMLTSITAGASLAVCFLLTFLATVRTVGKSPIETLGTN